MRTFQCQCGTTLYFENTRCLSCGRTVGFLPAQQDLVGLDPVEGQSDTYRDPEEGGLHRPCRNYRVEDVCNWMVPVEEDQALCESCRLTQVIPDLSQPGNRKLWYRMERAKRRLIYTLLRFELPIVGRDQDPQAGLAFRFLADPSEDCGDEGGTAPRVMTGHDRGLITINLAEADPAERERMKESMGERYRTVLGHFRHESGHYYWDRLIADGGLHGAFRAVFGDERADYGASLKRYYAQGPGEDWNDRCISAYATAHPWEDWAETFAHYLHMVDALETAAVYGFALRGRPIRSPKGPGGRRSPTLSWYSHRVEFEAILDDWNALCIALNAMSRSMGQVDWYPFVVTDGVGAKLRFVHQVIHGDGSR